MKKYRLEAWLTLASSGASVTEWLEDAYLTDGLDPARLHDEFAAIGKERLADLGYTAREIDGAKFVTVPG